jgi:uncharacterized protein YaaR (DUF327 family)
LEDLNSEVDINYVWETIRENIKISARESLGYYELKKHKPWFHKGCSELSDQRIEAKLQWLQDQSETNGDNLKNVRREASRHFRNKKREYLNDIINELAMNSKNKNIRDLYRGINEFKRVYQPRNNLVKDENGDLLMNSHTILNWWENCVTYLFNVHSVSDVRQIEVHTAQPLVPGPSPFEVETAIAKIKKLKSPGSHQFPAELIQTGSETLLPEIHNSINSLLLFGILKNCLISGRSALLYQFTKRTIKLVVVIFVGYHCYQLHTQFYLLLVSFLKS